MQDLNETASTSTAQIFVKTGKFAVGLPNLNYAQVHCSVVIINIAAPMEKKFWLTPI